MQYLTNISTGRCTSDLFFCFSKCTMQNGPFTMITIILSSWEKQHNNPLKFSVYARHDPSEKNMVDFVSVESE